MSNKIQITESDIRFLVLESVKRILKEDEFIDRMNTFADKYGYNRYENPQAQGNAEDYAKNMIRQHNTFLRGVHVDPNKPEFQQCQPWAKQELAKMGITNPTAEDYAKFAATRVFPSNGMVFATNGGNAWSYAGGGVNDGRSFGGVAKIVRPYKLGNDRMKWFDEGDFTVRDKQENSYYSKPGNVKPGEVYDFWGDYNPYNSEVIVGDMDFGGWLTPEEDDYATTGVKDPAMRERYKQERQAIYRKGGDMQSAMAALNKKYGVPANWSGYSSTVSSRNNYYRGE